MKTIPALLMILSACVGCRKNIHYTYFGDGTFTERSGYNGMVPFHQYKIRSSPFKLSNLTHARMQVGPLPSDAREATFFIEIDSVKSAHSLIPKHTVNAKVESNSKTLLNFEEQLHLMRRADPLDMDGSIGIYSEKKPKFEVPRKQSLTINVEFTLDRKPLFGDLDEVEVRIVLLITNGGK